MIRVGDGPRDFVYLHGVLGLDADSAALAALGRHGRVHAPLLPGYDTGPDAPDLRTMLDITLYMLDVVESLGVADAIIVGHCMGGMIAAEMAAVAPNDITRLALVAPLGLWIGEHPIPDVFAMTPHDFERTLGPSPHPVGDLTDFDHLEAVLVRNARQLGMAGKLLFPIPDRGLSSRIHRIKADTLLVWAGQDRFLSPEYLSAFERSLPTSTTVVVPAASHMLPEEQPDDLATAIVGHFA